MFLNIFNFLVYYSGVFEYASNWIISRHYSISADVIPIFSQVTSRRKLLNVWYNHIKRDKSAKHLLKASVSTKSLSDIMTFVSVYNSLCFWKTFKIFSTTDFNSWTKINRAAISLNPSLSMTSRRYTDSLNLTTCGLHLLARFQGIFHIFFFIYWSWQKIALKLFSLYIITSTVEPSFWFKYGTMSLMPFLEMSWLVCWRKFEKFFKVNFFLVAIYIFCWRSFLLAFNLIDSLTSNVKSSETALCLGKSS